MMRLPYRVLFLCTGNSARSILAEAALRHWGGERFIACSAGIRPKGELHPLTFELLKEMELPVAGLRSKGWDEFAGPEAAPLDFVFTVCDNVAGEVWPEWPGQPLTAHWGVADPAAVEGLEQLRHAAFRKAYRELEARIKIFASLPFAALDRTRLKARLDAIGAATAATPIL